MGLSTEVRYRVRERVLVCAVPCQLEGAARPSCRSWYPEGTPPFALNQRHILTSAQTSPALPHPYDQAAMLCHATGYRY